MKAISLWEPWASLIRTGAKTIETRSWRTNYRGELLICAAKGGLLRDEVCEFLSEWKFQCGLESLAGPYAPDDMSRKTININDLNFGKAVAIVELVDCRPTVDLSSDEIGDNRPFGDFTPGRWAWFLKMVRNDFPPFHITGSQGFFEIGDAWVFQHMPDVIRG